MPTEVTRHCFRLQVKPERLEEYLAAHERVWPEMLLALESTGWQNYTIFIDTDGLLVGYFEAEPGKDPLAAMASLEVNELWQRAMSEFFEGSDTTKTDGFRLLTEAFNLDNQLHALAAENRER